jgi:hypothetical protein
LQSQKPTKVETTAALAYTEAVRVRACDCNHKSQLQKSGSNCFNQVLQFYSFTISQALLEQPQSKSLLLFFLSDSAAT